MAYAPVLIQDSIAARIATYQAIKSGNKNLGGSSNNVYIIVPTQNEIASINFNLEIGNVFKVILTNPISELASCAFTLWENYDQGNGVFTPLQPLKVLTIETSLNSTNSLLVIANISGNFSIVKDFSAGLQVGAIGMFGSNNPIELQAAMQLGIERNL